jgi:hypothetical protein
MSSTISEMMPFMNTNFSLTSIRRMKPSAIFKENNDSTRNLSDNILKAIRSIKYYDSFDKLANRTIQKLNYISEIYNIDKSLLNTINVDYIRNKYTMNSERKIHDNTLLNEKNRAGHIDNHHEKSVSNQVELF